MENCHEESEKMMNGDCIQGLQNRMMDIKDIMIDEANSYDEEEDLGGRYIEFSPEWEFRKYGSSITIELDPIPDDADLNDDMWWF